MKILSICTSAGLWDKVLVERGHEVVPGCELMEHKRALYRAYVDPMADHVAHDLCDLVEALEDVRLRFDAIIGGPPCQSLSTLRAIRDAKFTDLTPWVKRVMAAVDCPLFLFENVRALDLPGLEATKCNAMHWPERHPMYSKRTPDGAVYTAVHQSRVRWFTHSPAIKAPPPRVEGTVDDLMAYPVVAGRIYGPKRGAVLQGHPAFADLDFPCKQLQEALADAVPRGLATAWAQSLEDAHATITKA